ncbi:MAG: prephenate dehydrogenase/arogenate dehydrogenase family protein [Gammaproteobacteria bacterium]|nr:prephenate dehydrogenase/arogenate dehydrogenase family protein [Gammaproteobacteria bacterium]
MNKPLLVVIGTGLIGSSFARGAREQGLFNRIVGIEPDAGRAEQARKLGIVDEIATSVDSAADAVLIAGPSDTIADWVIRLSEHAGVVFDVGSVKSAILDAVRASLGGLPPRFIPCHPIAGSERRGPEASEGGLFAERKVVITPHADIDPQALASVAGWWQQLGARVHNMEASVHDRMLALTSHLPHLVAFAYLQQIDPEHLEFAGGGFRDFTRIGRSDESLWSAIFELNKTPLLEALEQLERSLEDLRSALETGDMDGVRRIILAAQQRRLEFERHE